MHTSTVPPSCRSTPFFGLQCRSGVYPEWHFILLHRGPARPLPLPTGHPAHPPACWSLVTGQQRTHHTAFTGSGVCTHCPSGNVSAHSSTQTGPVGGVWAELKDCLAFGTYFPAEVALTEPPTRGNRPAVLLAVQCGTEDQLHLAA